MTAPMAVSATHEAVVKYFAGKKISLRQNVPAQGLASAGGISLSHEELIAAIPEAMKKSIPSDATAVYFVSVKTTAGKAEGSKPTSNVAVSIRILIDNPKDLDSPLRGRPVRSNGSLEKSYVGGLTTELKAK